MKRIPLLLGALLAFGVHAASPPDGPEPAVTAPAAATPPAPAEEGRGNPRRPELQAAPATDSPDNGTTAAPRTGQAPARGSADRIELDATQITGNAELPRVMYVVPWKRPELGDLNGRPAKSLLDEVLAPVDRDVFRRQNRYYDALQPDGARARPAGEK